MQIEVKFSLSGGQGTCPTCPALDTTLSTEYAHPNV